MIEKNIINEKPTCNCGIFGITGNEKSAYHTYFGLTALQHRGQEAAGIVTRQVNGDSRVRFGSEKGFGLVADVFNDDKLFTTSLSGTTSIGHNRYSTTGKSDTIKNIQPFFVNYRFGNLAVAHNGNLTNAKQIREELIHEGALFQTSSDTEVILHLIARCQLDNQIDQIKYALNKIEGAYSLLILTDNYLIGARDPNGYRPLCLGTIGDSFVITSETCALDINKGSYIRDINPGEMLIIPVDSKNENEIKSIQFSERKVDVKHCIFEYIYFSRPDSQIFGSNVDKIRRKLGKKLAEHHAVYTDSHDEKVIVISVPDSSNTAAIGYQQALAKEGIKSKLEIGLIRSHYIGRTFILPGQIKRELGVRIKFNTVKGVLEGKKIVLIDDSIVRGTTMRQLISLIREANPKEIHVRISSPPIFNPCYYGMDFPSKDELIANKFDGDIEEIRKYLGADSLEYLTEEELLSAMVDHAPTDFCTACFTGKYPTPVDFGVKKEDYDL